MKKKKSFDKTNLPLHKRTHWRNLKAAVSKIAKNEKIDISSYDTSNITCYSCSGDELKGTNVTFSANERRSCWVSSNDYEMFEIPSKSNSKKDMPFVGDFLFLSHNVTYDYWVVGELGDQVDYSAAKNYSALSESYSITPRGTYIIVAEDGKNLIRKECSGYESMYGTAFGKYTVFDSFGTRKNAYTGMTTPEIISAIGGKKKSNGIVDNKAVKKYKRKNKKKGMK